MALADRQVGHLVDRGRIVGRVVGRVQLTATGDLGRIGNAGWRVVGHADRERQGRIAGAVEKRIATRRRDRGTDNVRGPTGAADRRWRETRWQCVRDRHHAIG